VLALPKDKETPLSPIVSYIFNVPEYVSVYSSLLRTLWQLCGGREVGPLPFSVFPSPITYYPLAGIVLAVTITTVCGRWKGTCAHAGDVGTHRQMIHHM
jgi:hypothetical protein